MPGLLGGFIAGIAAFGQAAGIAPHGNAQLGFQILSLMCTVAIASTGGALVCALATGMFISTSDSVTVRKCFSE